MTRSLASARETLGLDHAYLVHAGEHSFPLSVGVRAVAFSELRAEFVDLMR